MLALCGRLTSLALSNNYLMAPSALGALLPAAGGCTVAGGAVADASAPLARLIDLDISYCEVSAAAHAATRSLRRRGRPCRPVLHPGEARRSRASGPGPIARR